jgi:hypothetical protein
MKGQCKVTVIEDNEVVQSVENSNKVMMGSIDGLLNNIFDTSLSTVSSYLLGYTITFDGIDNGFTYADIAQNYGYSPMELIRNSGANAIQIQDGPFNKSAYFDGSTGYYHTSVDYSLTSYTLECWCKVASAGSYTLIQWGYSTGVANVYGKSRLWLNSGVPTWDNFTGTSSTPDSTSSSLGAISTNVWHHIVGVRSNTNGSLLFVDGILVGRHAYPIAVQTTGTANNVLIGFAKQYGTSLPSWGTGSNINPLTGNIANISFFHSEGIYTGTILGQRYFTPDKYPKSMCNSLGRYVSTASNYRPFILVLSRDSSTSRLESSYLDDYAYAGTYVDTTSFALDLTVPSTDYTLTMTRESETTVKLSITLYENIAVGDWNSLLLLDNCPRSYGNMESLPKVAKVTFSSPVSKRNRSVLVIDWVFTLSN